MKDTLEDIIACKTAVEQQLEGYSIHVAKIVLLTLLRDIVRFDRGTPERIAEWADSAAEFLKMPEDGGPQHDRPFPPSPDLCGLSPDGSGR